VQAEWSVLFGGGKWRLLAGSEICCAHHGYSVLLTAHGRRQAPDDAVRRRSGGGHFQRNTEILAPDLGAVEAVVLSHGHWDHAGGLLAAVESIAQRRGAARASIATCIRACSGSARPAGGTA
jgi:7,8-dihydropterin-6-yl-methyl-4-(beta-D-ribofuranosyl)aminobenzene 5'-phosphate synthase